MPATPPVLSVVTATRAGSVRLVELIASLGRQDLSRPWEWVVVLDGVVDETPALLASADLPVRVVTLDEPLGVAGALDRGYHEALAPVVMRCDDDLTLPPHLLSGHLAHHEGAAGPVGVVSLTRDVFAPSRYATAYGAPANERLRAAAYARPAEERWRHWAACNSVRRDRYLAAGGFDPALRYREDSDLGLRLARSGVRIEIDPALEVLHRGPVPDARSRARRAFLSGATERDLESRHGLRAAGPAPAPSAWSRLVGATARTLGTADAADRLGASVDAALPLLPGPARTKAVALAVEASGAAGRRHEAPEWVRTPTTSRGHPVDRLAARVAARPGPLDTVAASTVAVATDEPVVVLTYDDGPTPGVTDALLPVLERHGARATFFVLGGRAEASPGLLREVLAAGHELAVHGPDHQPLTRFTGAEVHRRTTGAKHRLEDLCGVPMRWFRPPYGAQGLRAWRAVRRTGLEPVLWGATLNDWHDVPDEQRLRDALAGTAPGAVVLGHDGYAGPADGVDDGPAPALDRPRLLEAYLDALAGRGLRATSLDEAARGAGVVRRAWLRS